MTGISPSTVLPALRKDITLHTSDGLTLVGELARPVDGPGDATLVTLHPLPTAGGFMDSHVLRKASFRLPALANVNVLRFNTRGTCSPRGCSEGAFDEARGEKNDVEAAVQWAIDAGLPNIWLLGWSFGSDVVLRHGVDLNPAGIIVVSPPLRYTSQAELARWNERDCPVVCLVPEDDDYLQPEAARERFAVIPRAEIVVGEGMGHLWVGEPAVRTVLAEVTARMRPGLAPLQWQWPDERAQAEGAMERWTDL